MDMEVNVFTHLLMDCVTQSTMAAMAAPATSVRSPTSARNRCSTIADITLSGISLAGSHPVETGAKVHFVSAFGSIIAKCAQTLPATRHTSEK